MASSMKHELAGRLGLVYLVVIGIAVLIVIQALYVQVWKGDELRRQAQNVSKKDFVIAPVRGNIYADDGRILASSVPYYSLRWRIRCLGERWIAWQFACQSFSGMLRQRCTGRSYGKENSGRNLIVTC